MDVDTGPASLSLADGGAASLIWPIYKACGVSWWAWFWRGYRAVDVDAGFASLILSFPYRGDTNSADRRTNYLCLTDWSHTHLGLADRRTIDLCLSDRGNANLSLVDGRTVAVLGLADRGDTAGTASVSEAVGWRYTDCCT